MYKKIIEGLEEYYKNVKEEEPPKIMSGDIFNFDSWAMSRAEIE